MSARMVAGAGDAKASSAGSVSPARKVAILCSKDFGDLFKNPTLLVMCVFPVLFIVLYRFVMGNVLDDASVADVAEAQTFVSSFMLATALSTTVGMVTTTTVIYGLAEEKEKHTLRTLMLANVSAGQILTSRLILAMVVTCVVAAVCFVLIPTVEVAMLPAFLVTCLLGAIPAALLSMVLGLAARDQMTASLYGTPLMLLCILPMMAAYGGPFAMVARFSPTGGAVELLNLLMTGSLWTIDALLPLGVTLAWIVVGVAVFAGLYKRLLRDN